MLGSPKSISFSPFRRQTYAFFRCMGKVATLQPDFSPENMYPKRLNDDHFRGFKNSETEK